MKELEFINKEGKIYVSSKQFNKEDELYLLFELEGSLSYCVEDFNVVIDKIIDGLNNYHTVDLIVEELKYLKNKLDAFKDGLIKINILDEFRNEITFSNYICSDDYIRTILYDFDFKEFVENEKIIMNVYLLK